MKHTILFFTFLFTIQTLSEGFAAGTLVKTDHGYLPIEHVYKKRRVICRSLKKYKSRTDKVFYTYKTRVPKYVKLTFASDVIKCAPDQQFYIRTKEMWVTALRIATNPYIQTLFTKQAYLKSAEIIQAPLDVYIFTTKTYHNFLVSYNDILVHNLEPLFATASLASIELPFIAEGATTLLSSCNPYLIVVGVVTACGYFLYDWATSKHRNKKKVKQLQQELDRQREEQLKQESKNATAGSPGPRKDPDDDKDKKKRIVNTMSLPEAKKQPIFKKYFSYYKDGAYQANKQIKKHSDFKRIKYIKWDHLHNEWEAYCKNEFHLGALDPYLKNFYKNGVKERTL